MLRSDGTPELTTEQLATFYNNTKRAVRSGVNNSEFRGMVAMNIEALERAPAGAGTHVVMHDLTADRLGQLARMSVSTAQGVLESLSGDKHIIGREVKRYALGNTVETEVTVTAPLTWPPLPANKEKATTPRAKRDQARAAETRDLANQARAILAGVACPVCGVVGDWHFHCGECGAELEPPGDLCPDGESPLIGKTRQNCTISADAHAVNSTDTPSVSTESNDRESALSGAASVMQPVDPPVSPQTTTADVLPGDISAPLSASSTPTADELLELATLTGAPTVEYLADCGVALTCVLAPGLPMHDGSTSTGKEAMNPRAGSYTEHPRDVAEVLANIRKGWNAGMLPGVNNWYVIDFDETSADAFIASYPEFALCGRVWRDNAPGRAKLLFMLEDDGIPSRTYQGAGGRVEFLGKGGHAVTTGRHKSGVSILFTIFPDVIPVWRWADVEPKLKAFTGDDADSPTPTPAGQAGRGARSADERSVIDWWNEQPANQALAKREFESCRKAGPRHAVRADDEHPSTTQDATTWKGGTTWTDWGDGKRKYDALDMHCACAHLDRDQFIKNTVIPEYRATHELQPAHAGKVNR